ncbi:MAG: S1 RNA-binding domain-containing protein [Eubacteriales bacterium]
MTGKTYVSSYEERTLSFSPETAYLPEGSLRGAGMLRNRAAVEEAIRRGTTVEAMCVLCDCTTMQLTVELPDGIRGILPRSEAGWSADGGEIKDIAIITRVGKPVQFKITDLYEDERGGLTAMLSRRAAQRECYERYISRLTPGDIIPARVTHLEPFGAFCDIGGGIVSLLTVDRISVSRISHPSDRFRSGEAINVVVQSIEEDGRIYLTHRELLGTWEENAAAFAPGQTVTGIIRSVEEYGVFVELAPNLAGLAESFEGARPGDACSVYIKSLLPERMKIKLVLIDTCGRAETAPCRYFIRPAEVRHMTHWRYSPAGCRKLVETDFGTENTEDKPEGTFS